MATKIEWTDETWNPITGCTQVSPGCDSCYALTFAERWRGTPGHYFENGFDVQLRPDKLTLPLRWKKPRKIFVNSMSDLFHADIPDDYIARTFAVMTLTPHHTYQLLTKRHARMRSLLSSPEFIRLVDDHREQTQPGCGDFGWPLPNLWLGVSVENQQWADIRIPALLDTPAAVRWISAEPLLGPIDLFGPIIPGRGRPKLTYWLDGRPGWGPEETGPTGLITQQLAVGPRLDWVVVGGESGRNARPMHPDWARTLRGQCTAANISFLFKQHGEWVDRTALTGDERAAVSIWDEKRIAYVHPADGRTQTHGQWGVNDHSEGWACVQRVGKKAAGRELDGRTWDQYPEPR